MTGIIRFPRGSRPNKVTKQPLPSTRRATNGNGNGNGNGAANISVNRQLAIEQAIDEQQQQQQQQYHVAVATEPATGDVGDQIAPESAQALIQDGSFYNAPDEADGAVAHDQNGGSSKAEPDDSDMLDLHGGSSGGADGGGDEGGDNGGHGENTVTDMDEAEMSEMVSGAVESYAEENGIGVPRAATTATQPSASNTPGLDMDLSAAAAAAAAAAAVASASHLATAGHSHHRLRTETSSYSRQVPHGPQEPQESHDPSTEHAASTGLPDGTMPQPQPPQTEAATATHNTVKDGASAIHSAPVPETAPRSAPSTSDMAHDSGYSNLPAESALAKRLAREPGLRRAHQRRPDQQLNLGRRSNVEALFAHIAGEEVAVPCKNCHKGHGPWTACVVVDGQMCGSCANCWFNASGARCSFHETKTPMHGHPQRQSLGGVMAVLPPTGATSALDPQLTGSPLGAGGLAAHHAAHHFTAQQQQQQQQHSHQHVNQGRQQHALSSSLGLSQSPSTAATPPSSSSAAQQAAAAAAAAAVAVQQLSNGGHFPNLGAGATDGASSTGAAGGLLSNGSASAYSPFSVDLVTSLLGAGRSGGGSGVFDAGVDAASAASVETGSLVSLVINQALAEVHSADQRGRDLILVEIAAKQLALAIVRFGEGAAVGGETPPVSRLPPTSNADDASPGQHRDGPATAD
ncbi:hypothetical protein SCUCBS95973_004313 [Sporothrix curviconia]|uniref:Uncharacterized protein n=1 Tax=Sporothrix curviconia TaxID=1260050 RepID=A0ABP0BMT2_9PEZI